MKYGIYFIIFCGTFYLSNGYLVIKETRARGGRVEGRQKRIFFVVFLDDKLRFL